MLESSWQLSKRYHHFMLDWAVLQVNFAAAPMLGTLVQKGYLTRRTLLVIGLLVVSIDRTTHQYY